MLSKERVDGFIRKPLDEGLTRSEQMEMATELLSLREQMEALRALEPAGYLWFEDGVQVNCLAHDPCGKGGDEYWERHGFSAAPLFTAAKPADSVTLPAPANYEDYGPRISLEKTMAALALCGIEYTVRK
ncbi:hypothetical protein [Yersinia mollaretii]|uniref:hypothetical protein n=1 Tax=Yersinia mollaretii TaxID=33060 RepID=UPI00061BC9DF|nr:hypothetical protein [Yersinia mollaretii]CNI50140.1 Uncharacterised protein [Yersinia mollaretii]